jgi:hypothetical protein
MIQSGTMRTLGPISLLLLGLALPLPAADRTPPPVTPATGFPAVEVHDKEQVAIAVEPYNTKEKVSIFHIDYLKYDVMPVRLIVTNQGDRPISLRDARILFETAAGDRIQSAEPDDINRLMNPRERPSTIPMPVPIPAIHRKPKDYYKQIKADFDTFEYQALAVEPHTTRAGFLFYDLTGLANPLKGAHMYLRVLRDANGQELYSFEIPFDKYLQSKSSKMN